MGTQRVQMTGVLSWSVRLACRASTGNTRDFCSASIGCSCRPSTKYFFFAGYYFNHFVPNAKQAVQAVVLGHLSLSVCFCLLHYIITFAAYEKLTGTSLGQDIAVVGIEEDGANYYSNK
jgi:hypothetical protein